MDYALAILRRVLKSIKCRQLAGAATRSKGQGHVGVGLVE